MPQNGHAAAPHGAGPVTRYYICERAARWTVYKDRESVSTLAENLPTTESARDTAIADGKKTHTPFRVFLSFRSGYLEKLYDSEGER